MPTEGTETKPLRETLLSTDEPAAFSIENALSVAPILLVSDHGSRRIPLSLGTMGLDADTRRSHLAWDIGTGELTRKLAASLNATAVSCEYSRLVIDCNRDLKDPGAYLEFGDGVAIPGNSDLDEDSKKLRANEIYWPYHNAIVDQVERFGSNGINPLFVAVHSFTPYMDGVTRPWEIGVLWDQDRSTAMKFLDGFRAEGFFVGDNEPYSGKAPEDYTIDNHAEVQGLPHVGIEIRQDLLQSESDIARVAVCMHKIILSSAKNTSTKLEPKSA